MRMKYSRILLLFLTMAVLSLGLNSLVIAEVDEPAEPSSPPTWEDVITISTGDNGASFPSISAAPNGKDVIIAYVSQRSNVPSNTDPYYHDSSNNGATFPGSPAPINTNASTQTIEVAITFDSNNQAHASWVEDAGATGKLLRYAREANWPNSSMLISSVGESGFISSPEIVASGSNTLNIVWQEASTGGAFDIFYARSNDGGATWPINGVLLDTPGISQTPEIAMSNNGIIHVVWSEGLVNFKINYVQGTISGNTVNWSSAIPISDRSSATNALEPTILVNGSTVHVAYADRLSANMQFVHYLLCNNNCTNINNWISSNNPVSGQAVGTNVGDPFDVKTTIAQAGTCTFIYYHGVQTGSNEQILGVNSCDRWGASARDVITSSTIRALNPDLAVQNNWWIYLVYEDKSNERIQFLRNFPALYLPTILK